MAHPRIDCFPYDCAQKSKVQEEEERLKQARCLCVCVCLFGFLARLGWLAIVVSCRFHVRRQPVSPRLSSAFLGSDSTVLLELPAQKKLREEQEEAEAVATKSFDVPPVSVSTRFPYDCGQKKQQEEAKLKQAKCWCVCVCDVGSM